MLKILKPYNFARNYANKCKTPKNMKYLNVAEKHDAAKTIAGLLSSGSARRREGYSVYNKVFDFESNIKGKQSKMVMTSVSGHLLQLEFLQSYRNWRNVDPQALFEAPIRKVCSEDYQPIKRTLEREIKSCQGLIIWTDCDREGENIGFEIIDVCRAIKSNLAVYRAIFSEITATSVHRAIQNLATPDKCQSDAVDIRTELDLRTGAAITRFQTMRLQRLFPEKIADKLISYGSCQIPTLGFVVERYKEAEAFVSEPFWKIKVTHTIDDLTVDFNWARNRLFDKDACEDYLMLCLADPLAKVETVTVKPKNKWRPTPMDTVEMEKLGSRKLKLSAKETMTIAEKLYTKGFISYPRTETNMFSKEIDLKAIVERQCAHSIWGSFANRVIEWGPNPRNGSKSDQAHPPIHPTKLATNLDGNEARIYELICRHFLACVSKDAVGSETVVHINVAGEKFTATGLCIYERNYLDIYIYDKWNAKQIHKYEEGQTFEPTEITMQEGATTAPPLLTEADLITLMEKHGIGTDATHADHINTIKERGYIGVVDKGCLVPGVIGMGLYEGYDAMELVLAKPILRAQFEADLKKICLGEKDPKTVLQGQIVQYKEAYKKIMEKVTAMDEKVALRLNEQPVENANASNNSDRTNLENNPNFLQDLFKCPKCLVAPLALRPKKNQSGFFIGCLNYPDCKNVVWLPDDVKEASVLDETCQHCGVEVKLLKFKFATSYHKTMFGTPFGWYKTCLRCDAKLRNEFNINLENVKRVGGIVGNALTASSTTQPIANSSTSANAEITRNRNVSTSTELPRGNRPKKPKAAPKTTTAKKSTNIRNYCVSTTSTASTSRQAEQMVLVQSNDMPTEAFFDSNDGFDDLMIAAAEQAALQTPAESIRTPTLARNSVNELTDDIAAAFAESNDDDFDNFNWGTGGSTAGYSNITALTNSASMEEDYDNSNDLNGYSWGSAARNSQNTSASQQVAKRCRFSEEFSSIAQAPNAHALHGPDIAADVPNCPGCHQQAKKLNVKKDGPNNGRPFYVCPKPNACKFFQWADEDAQPSATTSHASAVVRHSSDAIANIIDKAIKCGCGNPANSLTVRKQGPNLGRPFYACGNRDKSCGFFQWGDEDNQASTSNTHTNQTWLPGSITSSSSAAKPDRTNGASVEHKKRKCGLCRQEGHTKQKCPRKAEFDI